MSSLLHHVMFNSGLSVFINELLLLLRGVKLRLFDRCKTTPVQKVYFLTTFPTVQVSWSKQVHGI